MLCNENIFSISNYLANFFQYFFFKLCSFQAYNTVYIEVTDMYVQLLRQTWATELKSAYISDLMLKSNYASNSQKTEKRNKFVLPTRTLIPLLWSHCHPPRGARRSCPRENGCSCRLLHSFPGPLSAALLATHSCLFHEKRATGSQ